MKYLLTTSLLLLAAYSYTISDIKDSSKEIRMSDNGIGPINGKTRFDQKDIQKLFPNCTVKRVIRSTEGEEFTALQIMENDDILFIINPDMTKGSIFSIEIKSNKIKNELGPIIGFTYSNVFKDSISSNCNPAIEEYSGSIICQDFRSKHIYYVFSGEYNGPDNTIPPMNILNSWRITEIIWKP